MEYDRTGTGWSARPSGLLALASGLCHLLESLGHAAAVLDGQGTILRATPAFRSATESLQLRGMVTACAHALVSGAQLMPGGGLRMRLESDEAEISSATLCFQLRRVAFGRGTIDAFLATHTELFVVELRITARGEAREQMLRDRFGLTQREAEVALLLAEGLSNPEVACRLALSVHTVRRHGERVFRKVGVRSRLALVRQVALLRDKRALPEIDESAGP